MAASSLMYIERSKTEVGSCNDHFVGIKLEELEWHPNYDTIRTNLFANASKEKLKTVDLAEAMNCRYKIMLHVGYLDNEITNEVGIRYAFGDAIITVALLVVPCDDKHVTWAAWRWTLNHVTVDDFDVTIDRNYVMIGDIYASIWM